MSDIEFGVEPKEIRRDIEIRGIATVSYPGRYDGVVINAQISDSNEHVAYKTCGDSKAGGVARLFIPKDKMPGGRAEFTAVIEFEPKQEHEVKFRASIIEQHKEVESKIVFVKYVP